MTYLLDVNARISLVQLEHEFHGRVTAWMRSLQGEIDTLASCSITELGVVPLLPQLANFTVDETRELLTRVKSVTAPPFLFLEDNLGADRLPSWVQQHRQVTDGHLASLAKAHGATLATLDQKIPGAFLIPA